MALTEVSLKKILNFFFFLLNDEELSVGASVAAIKILRKTLKPGTKESDLDLIQTVCRVLPKYKKFQKIMTSASPKSDWKMKTPEYMVVWKDFLRKSENAFPEIIVLRYVLGYSAEQIAKALAEPEGTIYFRINRGLEVLGGSPILQSMRTQ